MSKTIRAVLVEDFEIRAAIQEGMSGGCQLSILLNRTGVFEQL